MTKTLLVLLGLVTLVFFIYVQASPDLPNEVNYISQRVKAEMAVEKNVAYEVRFLNFQARPFNENAVEFFGFAGGISATGEFVKTQGDSMKHIYIAGFKGEQLKVLEIDNVRVIGD